MGLALGVSGLGSVQAEEVEQDVAADNLHYRNLVVDILRTHVEAMRWILDHENLKYDDNMVRHAEAFVATFGMVGPMGWHAAEAFKYLNQAGNAEGMTEAQFNLLADQSHAAMKVMTRAAHRYMRDRDAASMHQAIDEVLTSCNACHAKMPAGTVPDWTGLMEH